MKERLLADLDDRIARHVGGDSSGVLDPAALGLVTELTAHGEPDAGSLSRVAALHLCRYEALRPDGETDLRVAKVLYTRLHEVDPRLVPPDVRAFFTLAAPHEQGARCCGSTSGPGGQVSWSVRSRCCGRRFWRDAVTARPTSRRRCCTGTT